MQLQLRFRPLIRRAWGHPDNPVYRIAYARCRRRRKALDRRLSWARIQGRMAGIGKGMACQARQACRSAICLPLTDDEKLRETLDDLIGDIF